MRLNKAPCVQRDGSDVFQGEVMKVVEKVSGVGQVRPPLLLNILDKVAGNILELLRVEEGGLRPHHVLLHLGSDVVPPLALVAEKSGVLPEGVRTV